MEVRHSYQITNLHNPIMALHNSIIGLYKTDIELHDSIDGFQ